MAYVSMKLPQDCTDCDSKGRRIYSNTGGAYCKPGHVYGQAMTQDICNTCWGSGSKSHPYLNVGQLLDTCTAQQKEIKDLQEAINKRDSDHAKRMLAMHLGIRPEIMGIE